MRKWYVPITVLGLGGVGAFLLTDQGKQALRGLLKRFREAPDRLLECNETLQDELEDIQAALNRIAESLEPHRQPGY
jgi:hypothetical protein